MECLPSLHAIMGKIIGTTSLSVAVSLLVWGGDARRLGSSAMPSVDHRIAWLALLRELQVNGWTDMPTLRTRLHVNQKAGYKISGMVQHYAREGGLIGVPQGIDPAVGFPYKRWEVDDVSVMRRVSRDHHLPLMPPAGKERIKARCHGVD